MTSRIEPELVALIEEIVSRRLKEELEERAKLVTEDKFAQAMERIDRRFEEARKEREQLAEEARRAREERDRRFEEARKEREQLAEEARKAHEERDRRFEEARKEREQLAEEARRAREERAAITARMDAGFTEVIRTLQDIQAQIGKPFEQFARNVVTRILEGEGQPGVTLRSRHFDDPGQVVSSGNTDVEVDGYSEDPPVIVEITSILREPDKVENFLAKKRFVEAQTAIQFRGFFVASGTALGREKLADLAVKLRRNGCELINL